MKLIRKVMVIAGLGGAACFVLTGAPKESAPASTEKKVTPVSEVHRGEHVLLKGQVKRIRDSDEFVLKDESGSIRIYIGWKNRMPVSVEERIKVWGVADDDAFPGFRPEVYAYRIQLQNGKMVDLTRGHE